MGPVKLTPFQGHTILLCKNHYKYDNFFEALKMIWAIRCGYDYESTSSDVLVHVANDMYNIIIKCYPEKLLYLMELVHEEVGNQDGYKPKDMSPIEALIWEYRSIISTIQVKKLAIQLPKPQRRLFNRILRGNGRYEDYDLIIKSFNPI